MSLTASVSSGRMLLFPLCKFRILKISSWVSESYNLINFCNFLTLVLLNYCTAIMYLYLTCSISYGVNPYWDLWNVNKFKFKFKFKLKTFWQLCESTLWKCFQVACFRRKCSGLRPPISVLSCSERNLLILKLLCRFVFMTGLIAEAV
jgi:hypothetical protein